MYWLQFFNWDFLQEIKNGHLVSAKTTNRLNKELDKRMKEEGRRKDYLC